MTQDPPTEQAIRERASSLAAEAMHTVALQVRRLGTTEPEDETFVGRWWADLQFLIVALRRLRRAAELALRADSRGGSVRAGIEAFDTRLPGLLVMRNVGEHIDSYALDDPKRHHPEIDRRQLQVGSWDGSTFSWLSDENGEELKLSTKDAEEAAFQLYDEVARLAEAPRSE